MPLRHRRLREEVHDSVADRSDFADLSATIEKIEEAVEESTVDE